MSFKDFMMQQMVTFHACSHHSRKQFVGGKRTVSFLCRNLKSGHTWFSGMDLMWCFDLALLFVLDLHVLDWCLMKGHDLLKLSVCLLFLLSSKFLVIYYLNVPSSSIRICCWLNFGCICVCSRLHLSCIDSDMKLKILAIFDPLLNLSSCYSFILEKIIILVHWPFFDPALTRASWTASSTPCVTHY